MNFIDQVKSSLIQHEKDNTGDKNSIKIEKFNDILHGKNKLFIYQIKTKIAFIINISNQKRILIFNQLLINVSKKI